MMPILVTRDAMIPFDDRICQFRIIKHQPDIEFEAADILGNADRD